MKLVQDCQKVILTKEMLFEFANKYYTEKTGKAFSKCAEFCNFKWNENDESISISIITNYEK